MELTTLAGELTPAQSKVALAGNYLDIQNNGWAQQYLPELYEAEVERYGDRSISSFLRLVGAEMPMASDQVIWSEQGRLHISYTATVAGDGSLTVAGDTSLRAGQTIAIGQGGSEVKAIITSITKSGDDTVVGIKIYATQGGADLTAAGLSAGAASIFVYGSEFGKGTTGMTESLTPEFHTFTNNPIILKDHFEISGSDASQIGWVEVTGEAGQTGYLWYIKAEGDTRTRFEDYLEMSMIEAEKSVDSNGAASPFAGTNDGNVQGSEGLFAAINSRGNVSTGGFAGDATDLADFDEILKQLDKQGAIEENVLFVNRSTSLAIDDMLASLNVLGNSGLSYGVFNNSEDMALNLGFSGFRRGSYDFYKTDWKYLNDASTRGNADFGVKGVLVPAGTSSVYDQMLGKNVKRPFLHVRYRASEADNRRMKSWVLGSVGAATSSLDAMQVEYLSERCLVTQAANNFVLFK